MRSTYKEKLQSDLQGRSRACKFEVLIIISSPITVISIYGIEDNFILFLEKKKPEKTNTNLREAKPQFK